MEKYFCNYNQSLALKELDYDEPCLAYYDGWNGQTHLIMFDEENPSFLVRLLSLFKRKIKQTYGQDYVEYLTGICSAPLKSQVFEWARNKHNYVYQINYLYNGNYQVIIHKNTHEYMELIEKHPNSCIHEIPDNYSYEEAESACIDELIKIVKNGRKIN